MRLLIVTLLIPFSLQFSGLHGLDLLPATVRVVRWDGLLLLFALAGAGAWILQRLDRANPWFLGALLVAMGFTMADLPLSALPAWLSSAAQLFIGVSLGVRFTPAFVHTAPRWLATAPGGIAEMSITAKVLQLGAPVVTAFQVCRLIAVLLLVEPLFR
jgi:uncharacterized membrane protein AbrB (regulator of aidB expression)